MTLLPRDSEFQAVFPESTFDWLERHTDYMDRSINFDSTNHLMNKKFLGWNMEIFDSLSPWAKKAYILAAELHHDVFRKDGLPYLYHINRTILFYQKNADLFWGKFDFEGMIRNIALHDCAEDNIDGVARIYKEFWWKVLGKTLWMSEPNFTIRKSLPEFIQNLPKEKQGHFLIFQEIVEIVENRDPTLESTRQEIAKILPWKWLESWVFFAEKYTNETHTEKKKDVFASWVFQGMLMNMPEDCFLAKSAERCDNLQNYSGLTNASGWISYQRTLNTTQFSYIPRLESLGYKKLSEVMGKMCSRGMLNMVPYMTQWLLPTSK